MLRHCATTPVAKLTVPAGCILSEALQYELQGHGIRVKIVEPGGSKTEFSTGSIVSTPHPEYKASEDGVHKVMAPMLAKLPGLEKVEETIYRAATDGSSRLRYPVLAFPYLTLRNLLGARVWSFIFKTVARRLSSVAAKSSQLRSVRS